MAGLLSVLSPLHNSIAPEPGYPNTGETSTNRAMNNVCLCIYSRFQGKKREMVHKGITLTLAGISVKEEEINFKGKELPSCVLNALLPKE